MYLHSRFPPWPTDRARHAAVLALACAMSVAHGAVTAGGPDVLGLDRVVARLDELPLPPGSRHLGLGSGFLVDGIPTAIRLFDAPGPVDAVLRVLAAGLPPYPDLLVRPGAMLVSWRSGGWHWVARLSGEGAGRTRGTLSAMREHPGPLPPRRFSWMPPGERLLLDVHGIEAGRDVVQQVLAHPLPPDRLVPAIEQGLRRTGWRAHAGLAGKGGTGRWVRAREQLFIHLAPLDRGSGLTIRRLSPAAPSARPFGQ